MSYIVNFTDQTVDPVGKAPIIVQPAAVDTGSTSLTLTGKSAPNYGELQQENLIHLLENFASATEPDNPTVGQIWYDNAAKALKVLTSKAPATWKFLGGVQLTEVGEPPPAPPRLGDLWFERTGTSSGFLYVYTGLGRYPKTATTIGGWDQIYPRVETFAGREEYDTVRDLVDRLIGEGISTHGSGAIGRSIQNLTNFGALDNDLRQKYAALGSNPNVLISPTGDPFIVRQAPSNGTLFFRLDNAGIPGGANDFAISGNRNSSADGTILVNGVATTVPPFSGIPQQSQVDNAYIIWDPTNLLGGSSRIFSARFNDSTGSWEYEINLAPFWVPFTASPNIYAIGQHTTFQFDNNSIMPGNSHGTIWATAVPLVGSNKLSHLKVEPDSQDWDQLLAAARYALNRLELPPGFVRNISALPFVNDGRRPEQSLTDLPVTDARFPSGHRRSGRRFGTVTQVSAFNETVNALNTAIDNRFSLKGINGATGTNPTFAATTTTTLHRQFTGTMPTGAGTLRVRFRWTNFDEFYRWLGAGQGLQVRLTHVGGANAADNNLRSALTTYGTWRIVADRTRVMGQSVPYTMTAPISNVGIWNSFNAATPILLSAQTFGSVTIAMNAYRISSEAIEIGVVFSTGGALAGTTNVFFDQIIDTETFGSGSTLVYPRLLTYQGTDLITNFA